MFDKITDRHKRQELTQQAQAYMADWKKKTFFPKKDITPHFRTLVLLCFKFVAPHHVQMTIPDYRALLKIEDNKYRILDMGTMLWVMQQRTQQELEMSDLEYDRFLGILLEKMEKWQQLVNEEEDNIGAAMEKAELQKQDEEYLKNSGEYKKDKFQIPTAEA